MPHLKNNRVDFSHDSFGTPHIPLFNLSSLTGELHSWEFLLCIFPTRLVSLKGEYQGFAKKAFFLIFDE